MIRSFFAISHSQSRNHSYAAIAFQPHNRHHPPVQYARRDGTGLIGARRGEGNQGTAFKKLACLQKVEPMFRQLGLAFPFVPGKTNLPLCPQTDLQQAVGRKSAAPSAISVSPPGMTTGVGSGGGSGGWRFAFPPYGERISVSKRMKFLRKGDLFCAVRITGPSHNMLGLGFGSRPAAPFVEELKAPGPRRLSADDIQREASAGAEEELRALKLKTSVRHIQFVASDSGPASIYRDLARSIVRNYAAELGGGPGRQPGERGSLSSRQAAAAPAMGAARRSS